jgi:hypothetical protein
MKSYLLFKNNGEIFEKKTKEKLFGSPNNFDFTDYVKYENYIILHNNNNNHDELNKTIFYFTKDRFKGDIILLKIDDNYNIKNLRTTDYFKKLTRIFQEFFSSNINDVDSDSDTDLSIYGNLLTKEPFEY